MSVPLSITEYSQKDLFPELDFDMTDTLHPLDVALLYKIVPVSYTHLTLPTNA